MKLLLLSFLSLWGSVFTAHIPSDLEYDWANIKPNNIYVDPIGPAPDQGSLKIIGGDVAARGAFPYQAALIVDSTNFCGGSIISSEWILTAAHCIYFATNTQVIVGAHNPRTTTDEPTQVRLVAAEWILQNLYSPTRNEADVAVIRVSGIPVGSTGISAIELAPSDSPSYAGATATLSGWGLTSDDSQEISDELRYIQLPIITVEQCRLSFGTQVGQSNVCTSGADGRGACNGDSGGALVVDGLQIGIVSFGAAQCAGGHPTVYSRVSSYRTWITTTTGV